MVNKSIGIHLSIEITDDIIFAHLLFSNDTNEDMHLDTWAIFEGNEMRNNYFNILDEKGEEVKYVGMLLKRMFNPEDFIVFHAGEKIKASIALNDVYRFVKGNKYSIKYSTYHPASLDEKGIMKLESNSVEINY